MTDTKRKKFNSRVYGELLLRCPPRPIQKRAENERDAAVVEADIEGEDND